MKIPKLTQFSPGAGCGCKISPEDLETIMKSEIRYPLSEKLIVGNNTKDDALVYDIGNQQAIISTTDFFTPIVDDAYDFGRIAAANAISDIYAMGGKPVTALAILGWPIDKLSTNTAKKVIEGAYCICNEAGVSLAGGHSIDISDPVFGLAVNGIVHINNIKQNSTATEGCKLFLTKPLGIGILTTAEKKSLLKIEHKKFVVDLMCGLNKIGEEFGRLNSVKAMTDVTGFGFLGHLLEICEASNVNAVVKYNSIPVIEGIELYIKHKTFPGGTFKNWKSYGHKINNVTEHQKYILCDPQTSGGLLVAVEPDGVNKFLKIADKNRLNLKEIGYLKKRENENEAFVYIK